MPYINKHQRTKILETPLGNQTFDGPGELNYAITMLCMLYVDAVGLKYVHLNDVHGVLDCASREFYRRVTSEYEDDKKDENGDVYYELS